MAVLVGAFAAVAQSMEFTPGTPSTIASESLLTDIPAPQARPALATGGESLATPTAAPQAAPTQSPSQSAATLSPPVAALPPTALLVGVRHEYQGWNNCAPSSLGMVLSYFGRAEAQAQIAPVLKPDPSDKNVSPHEFAAYAQTIGYRARVGVGGDIDLLKRLLAAGLPVIVEIWLELEPDDGMGHYRVLLGYDDGSETFTAHDSYVGPNLSMSYAALDDVWRVFNRTFVVIYPQASEAGVTEMLEENLVATDMWQRALATAEEEIAQDRNDAYAWFNLGTSALNLGDTQQAAQAFDWARQLGLPWRMLWYQFGPFEAYLAQGRYQDVIALATTNLERASVEEWLFWRGRAREMTGDVAGAREDYQAAIRLNANYAAAIAALENSGAA